MMADSAEFEPILLLEDEPVPSFGVDELSLVPFAKVIAGAAAGTGGPFTIGVFADWGEGKTSVLRQAKSLLDTAGPHVVTVWFNAWQYEKEDHPILPLVATIVRAIDQKLAAPPKKRPGKAALERLAKIGRALRAIAYGFSGKAKVSLPGFGEIEAGFVAKEMIERYEKLQAGDDPLIQRTLYYHAFETLEAATGATEANRPKIVVFVDDLDRCLPPQGLKLLESIKLVLSQPGFIFVLAVDRRIIEGYLVKRYKDDFGIAAYEEGGKSYLDKIVQLPLPLPPHRSRFDQYIEQLLRRHTFDGANEPVRRALGGLIGLLALGSNHNPRNLVRFINNLIVDCKIWTAVQQEADAPEEMIEVDARLLGLCAVSRILMQHLGDRLYTFLMRSKDICRSLAGSKEDWETLREKTRALPADELTPAHESIRRLLRRLDELDFLKNLLETEAGRRWLVEPEERDRVNEFLIKHREETPEPLSSEEIIEQAIRRQLHKPQRAITDEDLKSIEELDLSGTQLSDLSFVARLSNLQRLYLCGTDVSDVSPLGKLSNLRELHLSSTQVTDVSSLAALASLERLNLSATRVKNVSSFACLSKLQELYLSDTKVNNISRLAQLCDLGCLDLENTEVQDISPLASLSSLQGLNLSDTQVTDASSLGSLVNLKVLYLSSTGVKNVSCLVGLANLQLLDLRDTNVSKKQIQKVQMALRNCRILH